jgi:hypothetical protein
VRKTVITIVFLAICPLLPAQQTLNNDSVIKMVKMGFAEDMIVNAIARSPGEYDTSANGLVALKNAGVGNKAISAMVSKTSAVVPAQATPAPVAPESAATVEQSTTRPQTLGYQFGNSAPGQPCVILKRMGPADEVTSHLYAFGIRGKQFQYEGGKLPASVKFHGRLTDNDVRTIQNAGGRVEIIEAHFSDQELEHARKSCGINDSDLPATAPVMPSAIASFVTVKSTPDGADITVDGKYSGSTPSKLSLPVGAHTILVEQTGYAPWQKTVPISPGNEINVNAVLQRQTTSSTQ